MDSIELSQIDRNEFKNRSTRQLPPNEYDLILTLGEIYHGCLKVVQIDRKIIDRNNNCTVEQDSISVQVKPGLLEATRIAIPRKGDREHGKIDADLVFIIRDEPHASFQRVKFDLHYKIKLTVEEATLDYHQFQIPTLDNREPILLEIQDKITAQTERTIQNRGFPYPNNLEKYGNLIVKFEIIHKLAPKQLDLFINLNEIFHGCTKNVTVNRKVTNSEGNQTLEEKKFFLSVKPGIENETKLTYPNEGDQNANGLCTDLVFIVRTEPNPDFTRDGANLIYTAQITSLERTKSCELSIPVLDSNKAMKFKFDGPINIDGYRIINRGLPHLNDSQKRGDLVVRFEVLNQGPPIEEKLYLRLEEIQLGCLKRKTITRFDYDSTGNRVEQSKTLELKINPGIKNGTRLTFPREGDRKPGLIPSDRVYITCDLPHEIFNRIGRDIEYTVTVSRHEFVNGFERQIPTLEKDYYIPVKIANPIEAYNLRRICGFGLPDADNPYEFGDLLIQLKIVEDEIIDEDQLHLQLKPNYCEPIEIVLPIALENILYGYTELYEFDRIITNHDGSEHIVLHVFKIKIKPGVEGGTRFCFANEGHRYKDMPPGDVVFIVQEKPHRLFKRNGVHLEYTARISARQSREGCTVNVPTLELPMPFSKTIHPPITQYSEFVIPGHGLPYPNDVNRRGDIVVRFKVDRDDDDRLNVKFINFAKNLLK